MALYLSFAEQLLRLKIMSGKIIITSYVEYKYKLVGFWPTRFFYE